MKKPTQVKRGNSSTQEQDDLPEGITPYYSFGRHSGIKGYKIDKLGTSMIVYFKDGSSYLYTALATGFKIFNDMKALARTGTGLNAYIVRNVGKKYKKKLS